MLRDADLLPEEIDDYDTVSFWEEGSHPTGINKNRMRLPEAYDISMYYERYKRNYKGRNKGEYGHWKPLSEEALPNITDVPDIDWQITYNFPEELHNNISPLGKVYGGQTVTYRRLYLILCERFNNKEYFIDTYFRDVYPNTVKEEVDVELQTLKDELNMYKYDVLLDGAHLTKSGELDRRYTSQNARYFEALRDYETYKEDWEDNVGESLADLIAEDIKASLANGAIPLNCVHTTATAKKRLWAGYDAETVFFAMGDLIDHIQIYVKVRS